MRTESQNIIYCDHSATTPLDPLVTKEMIRMQTDLWGNPSSVHQVGRDAKVELEIARETVANSIQAARNEILFTSGGTESDNFALRGIAHTLRHRGKHLITSKVEHHAVLHTCKSLEKEGFQITYLDVDDYGMVQPDTLKSALKNDTILVSIMHGNNEIGTINPISELARMAHNYGAIFHTDAVQTLGKMEINIETLGVDALSASGHKIYGPRGIGFLYLNKQIDITPQQTGGAQERNLRGGTENLPAIAGLSVAVQTAQTKLSEESQRLQTMQKILEDIIRDKIPDSTIHGHPDKRIPGLSHIGFEGVDGESLVMNLDMRGVAVSSGSACSSGSVNPSHVLLAMGYHKNEARNAIRVSLGRSNSQEQIPVIAEAIAEEVERVRSARKKSESSIIIS